MPLSEKFTRIYPLTVTVNPGTPIAAPVTVPWITEDEIIDSIELLIPPGPNGVTGIRVMKGDVQLIPWGAGTWIVANDYNNTFPVGGYLPTKDLRIQAYNTGIFPHSFYLRMSVRSVPSGLNVGSPTETDVIDLGSAQGSADPLSPDAILGPDTAAALVNGTLTADQISPVPMDPTMTIPDTVTVQ